jgi:hypothetical protein
VDQEMTRAGTTARTSAIGRDGTIWFVGMTDSTDLRTQGITPSSFVGGELDGFVAALSGDLFSLCYCSYYGGSDRDLLEGIDIAVDNTVVLCHWPYRF